MRYMINVQAARKFFRAASIDDCIAEFEAWRDDEGYGVRDIGAEYPILECLTPSGTHTRWLGTAYYNGRVELCAY